MKRHRIIRIACQGCHQRVRQSPRVICQACGCCLAQCCRCNVLVLPRPAPLSWPMERAA